MKTLFKLEDLVMFIVAIAAYFCFGGSWYAAVPALLLLDLIMGGVTN